MNGSLTIKKHANKIVNGFLLETEKNAQKKKIKKKKLKTKEKTLLFRFQLPFAFNSSIAFIKNSLSLSLSFTDHSTHSLTFTTIFPSLSRIFSLHFSLSPKHKLRERQSERERERERNLRTKQNCYSERKSSKKFSLLFLSHILFLPL